MASLNDENVQTLTPELRCVFEEVVNPDNAATSVEMEPLLEAFKAVGGFVLEMDYNQGYEIDYPEGNRVVRNIAAVYTDFKASESAVVKMARKPTDDQTVNFIKDMLVKHPAPAV